MMKRVKIWVGSDHAGFGLKGGVVKRLEERGIYEVIDVGPFGSERVDYPLYGEKVMEGVKGCVERGEESYGILICGTGIGMSLVANRYGNLRGVLCHNEYVARMARRHNDARVLCMGARVVGEEICFGMVDAFLRTAFDGGRHADRLKMLERLNLVSEE